MVTKHIIDTISEIKVLINYMLWKMYERCLVHILFASYASINPSIK